MPVNNATLKLTKPSFVTTFNTSPPYDQVIGNTIIWNNLNLNLLQTINFDVTWNIPASTAIGTVFNITAEVEPTDTTGQNNIYNQTVTVTGSYDPNDKQVQPEDMSPQQVNDYLTYTIRFQNTGTDTAFTVVIRDTLSNFLDVGTFRIVGASHPYSFIIRERGLLEVFFQNILLPDSFTNEPASHGFVTYQIKPKPGFQVGQEIKNTAYIYFDFNAPIVTNTVIR